MDNPTREGHISHTLHVLLNIVESYYLKEQYVHSYPMMKDVTCTVFLYTCYIIYSTIHCVRAANALASLRECTVSSELSQFANAAISNAGSLVKSCHAQWCF